MKHLKFLLTAILILSFFAADAQIKISALPTLTDPDSSVDVVPIVHSGTTYKITVGKLFNDFGYIGDNSWKFNGSTVGATKWIGTIDNFAFPIRTNNTEKARVFTSGELGIGITASPLGTLHIKGQSSQSPLYIQNNGNSATIEYTDGGTIKRNGVIYSVEVGDFARENTSWGYNVLRTATGTENTGVGFGALYSIADGMRLTAVGNNAGPSNVSGIESSYFGFKAGYLHTGSQSCFMGEFSGSFVASGNYFTAIGHRTLIDGSVTVGITGGNYVTALGAGAGQRGTSASVSNSTYLGSQTISEGSNEAVIGGKGNTSFYLGAGRFGTTGNSTLYDILVQPTSPATGSTFYTNQSNVNGINLTFGVSQPTGTGTAGDMIWQFAPTVQSSGATQNSLSTGMTFKGATGSLVLSSTLGAFTPNILTTTQRNALTASDGMLIYNSTTSEFNFRQGGSWAAIGTGGGSGTVTSIATTSPITGGTITTTGTIGIDNAAADGTTKGAASFAAADFNSSSGLISIDYTNGQAASGSTKGFLSAADWTTFNGKQAAGSYLVASGATTGATSQPQVFTNGIKSSGIDDNTDGTIELTFSSVPLIAFNSFGIQVPDGTFSNPSYLFAGSSNTGYYLKSTTEIGAAIGGALKGGFNSSGLFTDVISEQTAAAGVTIDGVLLKDGLILGANGGTGVANTGKTITVSGNTTIGSSTNTVAFATSGNTSVTLPTTGTLATLAGTETLTNKSIVGTQLTGTSYTFAANNTNATAAYTLNTFEDHPLATYAGTVTFNSGAPSSITSQQYAWSRIGNTVTLFFSIFYGTPGTTNTSAIITLPSDCPTPAVFAGAGDAASEYAFPISGARVEANMTGNPSAIRGGLRQNSSNNGWEVALIFGSVGAAQCQFTLTYRTN